METTNNYHSTINKKVLDQKWEWVEVKVASFTESTWKDFPVY
jgi:hypothetical protein